LAGVVIKVQGAFLGHFYDLAPIVPGGDSKNEEGISVKGCRI
jgi:hypothetical protein